MSARERGRPESVYHPEMVRDIGVQRLIAYWNEHPTLLRERIRRQPDFATREGLERQAKQCDAIVRAWMAAIDYVPPDHPDYDREVTFWAWVARLEPPESPETLRGKQERELFLRRHKFFYNFDINGKPWIDAIERVRHDRCIKIKLPPIMEDDEWL
jgi:hypothetical protein